MPYSKWKFSFMSHNASTPIRGRADGTMINNNYTFLLYALDNLLIIRFDDLNLMTMSYHCIFLEVSRNFQKKKIFFFFFSKSFFSLWVFVGLSLILEIEFSLYCQFINLFQQSSMNFSAT